MKSEYIDKLLADFYEGNTSQEEESYLYDFFSNDTMPPYLEREKNVFLEIYNLNRVVEVPQELKNNIELLINNLEANNSNNNITPLKTRNSNWKWYISIAASIIVAVSTCFYFLNNQNSPKDPSHIDTYSDPQEAYIVAQQSLLLASNKLNKGLSQLETIQNNIDKVIPNNIQK